MRQEEEATLMASALSSMETKQTGGAVVHSPLQRAGEVAALETAGLGESQRHTYYSQVVRPKGSSPPRLRIRED